MTPVSLALPGDAPDAANGLAYAAASASEAPRRLLVLAHGAGAGQRHPFMARFAEGLAARGIDVVTFDFPYMARGRRAPDKAAVLEEAFRRAITGAHAAFGEDKVFIGGKSMGGRMAVRVAADRGAWPPGLTAPAGVVVFGYPLNPPGRQAPDRAAHFADLPVPALIVQGTRDSFGGPEDIRRAAPHVDVREVPTGDHSFKVTRSSALDQAAVEAGILDDVAAWTAAVTLRTSRGA